jgi:hypothetical protein
VLPPLIGLAVAMVLHGTWNAAASEHHALVVYVYIMVPVFVGILVVAAVEQRRLRRLIARVLPMYARAGWLGPVDLTMLTSIKERRRAAKFVKARGGRRAARSMRDYQSTATELALLHDRGERHQLDPTSFALRQQALLRQLVVARSGFMPTVGPAARA